MPLVSSVCQDRATVLIYQSRSAERCWKLTFTLSTTFSYSRGETGYQNQGDVGFRAKRRVTLKNAHLCSRLITHRLNTESKFISFPFNFCLPK